MAKIAKCNQCGATYDDQGSVEQVEKWLAEPEPHAPCPNISCPGQMEIIDDEVKMNKDGQCEVCHRLHDLDMPCPLRVANAYTMQPQALEKLTEADKEWMKNNPNFSVLDVLEEELADRMGITPIYQLAE